MRTLSQKVADDAIIGQAVSNSGLDRFRIDDVQLHPLRREVRDPFRAMATDERDRAGTGHRDPCKRILKGPFEQEGVDGASLGTGLHEQVASGVKDGILHAMLVQGRMHGNKSVVRHVIALGRRGIRAIVDFALPPRCGGCGAITEELHSFCMDCWPSIEGLGDDGCQCCGLPLEATDAEHCARCLAKPPAIVRTRAAVGYGDTARSLILKLKYGRRVALARTMGRYMSRFVSDPTDQTVLLPVRLHRSRLWTRGYNQSALIAATMSRRTGVRFLSDGMRRTKRTRPLKGMNLRQRGYEVRGAFSIARTADIQNKKIILVDDVLRTGSTAEACAKALLKAGAADVELLCFARVVRPAVFAR